MRRLFSGRSARLKTPPRRVQTGQHSNMNNKLIDFHDQQFSQEACSLFIPEESHKSLFFSSDGFMRKVSKSRNLGMTEQSKKEKDSEDEEEGVV